MYANGINDGLETSCGAFSDDIKLIRTADNKAIRRNLDKVYWWPVKWDLPFNFSDYQ